MSKIVTFVLYEMMLISVIPMSAFAKIADWENTNVVFEGISFGTNESVTKDVITVTYVPKKTTYAFTIEFGKGSEVICNFEYGNLHGFLGQQDAYDWQLAHGVEEPFGL